MTSSHTTAFLLTSSQKAINNYCTSHTIYNHTTTLIRQSIHNITTSTTKNASLTNSHHLLLRQPPQILVSIPTTTTTALALAAATIEPHSLAYFLTYPFRIRQQQSLWNNPSTTTTTQCDAAAAVANTNTTTIETIVLHNDDRKILRRVLRRIKVWATTVWDAVLVLLRTTEIVIRLSPLVLLTPAAILLTTTTTTTSCEEDNSTPSTSLHHTTTNTKALDLAWAYTTYTLQKLGPVFVKLSQWAATRRDIFPESTCDRLSELHSGTLVHSWGHTRRILEEGGFRVCTRGDGSSGGGVWEGDGDGEGGVLLTVDREGILGSGCVAQVYRGTLEGKGNGKGRDVAVKVLHPNMLERTERDLLLMKRMAHLLDSLPIEMIKMLSLPRAIDNFSSILRHQVDLRNEGQNLHLFRDNFLITDKDDDDNYSAISFPNPLLVKPNCLVEQLVTDNGDDDDSSGSVHPITDLLSDNSEKGMQIRREVAAPLLRAFLKMVFIDNFVHCDLHPGNVLVRRRRKRRLPPPSPSWFPAYTTPSTIPEFYIESDKEEFEYSIIFLDAGIVTSLLPRDRQNLQDLFAAILVNDGQTAGHLMISRARYERCSSTPGATEAFAAEIASIVSEFHNRRKRGGGFVGKDLTLGLVGIGGLLGRVLGLCREFGVEIDPAMANVVMSTMVLEGLGRSLDEDLNLMECAVPFVLGGGKV